MSPNNLQINIDGGSRGNPGPAAYAFVVTQNNNTIHEQAEFIGETTNNVAEYNGLINALKYLTQSSPVSVAICMDSLLVIQQVKGVYKVKHPHLQILHKQIIDQVKLLKNLGFELTFQHVYRQDNSSPDALLNTCLDQHGK